MKKIVMTALTLMLVCLMILGMAGCNTSSEEGATESVGSERLIVYNWGDYIDPSVIDDFEEYYEEETGKSITVVYSTFDTNEVMLNTLEKGDETIDLICPSEYAIQRLMKKGLIQKLDKSKITNDANVDGRIYDKVNDVFNAIEVPDVGSEEKMSDYFVPYMWGTLGILYNTDAITEEDIELGYGLLWNVNGDDKLKNNILMKDSIRDAYVAAVLYLKECDRLPEGYEDHTIEQLINTVDTTMLAAVKEVLIEQGEYLKGYEVDFGKALLTAGRAYVDLAWSGDALWAIEDSDNLDYFVPEIGGNIWFDGWVMPRNAQNTEAAYMFIDFLCRPEVAICNSMEIGYTCAIDKDVLRDNEEVCAIIEDNEYDLDEYFDDEIRYPEITDKLGVMQDFGDMNAATVAMWESVKSSNQGMMGLLWIMIAVFGAIGVAIVIYLIVMSTKNSRRLVRTAAEVAAANGAKAQESGEATVEEAVSLKEDKQ